MKVWMDILGEVENLDQSIAKAKDLWDEIRDEVDILSAIEDRLPEIESIVDHDKLSPQKESYWNAGAVIFVSVALNQYREKFEWKTDGSDNAKDLLEKLDDKRLEWVAKAAREWKDSLGL